MSVLLQRKMRLLFCMRQQQGWEWKTRSLTRTVATGPWNQSLVRSGSGAAWCNRRLPPGRTSLSSWDRPCRWWESARSLLRSAPGSCLLFAWHNLGQKSHCRDQLLGVEGTLKHSTVGEAWHTANPPARRGLFFCWVPRPMLILKGKEDEAQPEMELSWWWFQNLCILILALAGQSIFFLREVFSCLLPMHLFLLRINWLCRALQERPACVCCTLFLLCYICISPLVAQSADPSSAVTDLPPPRSFKSCRAAFFLPASIEKQDFCLKSKCNALLGQLAANSSIGSWTLGGYPWVEMLSSIPGASPQSTWGLGGSC